MNRRETYVHKTGENKSKKHDGTDATQTRNKALKHNHATQEQAGTQRGRLLVDISRAAGETSCSRGRHNQRRRFMSL